jgi:hypothetical protein
MADWALLKVETTGAGCPFEDSLLDKEDEVEVVVVSSKPRTLAFKNGGCLGEGTTHSLSLSISTTSNMHGLSEAQACVQRSPIRSTFDASLTEYTPFKAGSTDSVIWFAL